MALSLGTNCGFVTSAPSADPADTNFGADAYGLVHKHTLPADASKVTEIGWYCDNATEEANFRVALYDNNGAVVPGEAGTRLFLSSNAAKGTTAGWKKITVDWDVSSYAGTDLWIAIGLDNTATATNSNYNASGGGGLDARTVPELPDPFGGGAIAVGSGMFAIYAVWEAAGGSTLTINIYDSLNQTEALD